MKHRAKVYDEGELVAQGDFDYLCDAVSFCNSNAAKGYRLKVKEVIRSLTGYEEYGTIVAWDYSKELT